MTARPRAALGYFIGIAVIGGISTASLRHTAVDVTLRVWKVGSPHSGNVPAKTLSGRLRDALAERGLAIEVETFPARGFAETFVDAVRRQAAPDVLVFENFGAVDGIVVQGEKFDGIAERPETEKRLVRVTEAYDEMLGPQGGWVYLFSDSPQHAAARAFAVSTPQCEVRAGRSAELTSFAANEATAFLEGDAATLQARVDPDRLARLPQVRKPVDVGTALVCEVWGNSRLAFARVLASYEGSDAVGRLRLLLIARKIANDWQLLVASRDPVSNGAFTWQLDSLNTLLGNSPVPSMPAAATDLQPSERLFPAPPSGQRFGAFSWRSSRSDDVIAEIVEFAYKDDARLIIRRLIRPGSRGEISSGQLWTTHDWWNWRVWSVSRTGDVAFSEVRSFYH